MHNNVEMIGIIDWYNKEKGYGVLKNILDQNSDYFIHQSKVKHPYNNFLEKGDIVHFSAIYDKTHHRSTAIGISYLNTTTDLEWAITTWVKKEYLVDSHLKRIIKNYLKYYDWEYYEKNESTNRKKAYNHLIDVFSSFIEKQYATNNLFSLLKDALVSSSDEQPKSFQLIEKAEMDMMKKLPSDVYFQLMDSISSPYTYFTFALKATNYSEEVINKVIDKTKDIIMLLDDLIRFTKDLNANEICVLLDSDKSLITNINFWNDIKGNTIISKINNYIFSTYDLADLKTLIKEGYIRNMDNPIIKVNRPDIYKCLMIYSYKEIKMNLLDISFIKDNINEFSATYLLKFKDNYNLSFDIASELFLYFIRYLLLNKLESSFKDILLFSKEIPDIYCWITANHSFLANNAQGEYKKLLVFLYKNNKVTNINDSFIIYNICEFSIPEVINIISGEQVNITQRKKVISSLYKVILQKPSEDIYSELLSLSNHAKLLLNEQYTSLIEEVNTEINDESKFLLWKNGFSDIIPLSYIRSNMLNSKKEGYQEFYDLYQKQMISIETACDELWNVLNQNNEVTNRPSFYTILYSIKYLLLINSSNEAIIKQKENDYYTLILWFLSISNSLNFELLCRLFIYFLPEDQVLIIKRLFHMAEENQFELTIEKLDCLLRIDADLYELIKKEQPQVPIDISSEIIIKSLVNLSKNNLFLTDKDVLNIVIKNGLYNKREEFKIGSYFDECKGRFIFNKKEKIANGFIKNNNDSYFNVYIFPMVEERVYTSGIGYNYQRVPNSSFNVIKNAVKGLKGRYWEKNNNCWKVPLTEKDALFEIAKQYSLEIDNDKNLHMIILEGKNKGKPTNVSYCEGRQALKKDEKVDKDFFWCRNDKCFNECVKEHTKEEWENYTLVDFCRILGLETDEVDLSGRTVRYGKYKKFASIINRANNIINHLYCRECGEMIEPIQISNYETHLVTRFQCTNEQCEQYHKPIYISKCFNWKCNGVIDDRDTKKCPNDWNICPECGSCCSNRIIKQRINHCEEIGIIVDPYLIDFINNHKGHLEKREFYCWKCGNLTKENPESIFRCENCNIVYERIKYDYKQTTTKYINENKELL